MGLLWDFCTVANRRIDGENNRNMENLVITISRQYGSGGSVIGPLVAEKLGIPCYDRNSIDNLAHERGLDKLYLPAWKKEASSLTIWGADDRNAQMKGLTSLVMRPAYYPNERKMFLAQSQLICELAEKGPCVFVGRCADYVLRAQNRCLRVWINGDEDSRALRLYNEYLIRTGSLAEKIRIVDRGRASYYKRCTGQTWGDFKNYHVHLDSGELGVDGCADAILCAVQNM